ncbi:Kinesin-like protein kif20a, variant 2 [Clonorchis sinensis]|uniref:Kinesin-like protein kif20a, variant 2 n=1 Tax=Clonorchis sinensis TaxID=79923 RepID=A0A8T1MLD7_CLOSI|nr:Kinesin-like protein kif20a, variant 2 [Clonorchis sinensis]
MLSFGTVEGFRLSFVDRNLLAEFEACDKNIAICNELMKVYLRLKPLKRCHTNSPTVCWIILTLDYMQPAVRCVNRRMVEAVPPDNQRFGVRDKKTSHTFTFSHVFDSESAQSSVFSKVALDQVRSFLEGLNGLLFAYGTTSSGKTYTLQGPLEDMGIVPRTFCALFRSVKHTMNPSLMPKDFSDVTALSAHEVEKLLRDKATVIKLSSGLPEDVLNLEKESLDSFVGTSVLDEPQPDLEVTPFPGMDFSERIRFNNDLRFTFWISFAEVYNELVYDLLDPVYCVSAISAVQQPNSLRSCLTTVAQKNIFSTIPPTGATEFANLRKKALDLRTDKNGNVFIKGLRIYPVSSAEEALRLVLVGRQCQKVAATRLNLASSRSHSILTIKAVRVVDKENPKFARISSLTFCDLAGSERSEKAATGGQAVRVREAGNINTSLLTLGRCIECLRYNQAHPENPKLVPYRDSKLTRLFQSFFTGRGKACMIVNVSPHPELFDETLHALRFSALATRIIVQPNVVVDTTIVQPKTADDGVPKRPFHMAHRMLVSASQTSQSIQETPSTVVPQRTRPDVIPHVSSAQLEVSVARTKPVSGLFDDGQQEETTLSATDAASPHTPTNTDGTELILDDYTKDELIFMVKELSEQLFEAKGELVEQEARLRHEMCEAMNRQLIEFERVYEEGLNAQEKVVIEQSNRRLEQIASRHTGFCSKGRKRFHRDDSTASNGDDSSSFEEYESVMEERTNGDNRCIESSAELKPTDGQESQTNGLQERLSELEGELADQRDVIENLSRERDQLRMEVTRLEFACSQLQVQLETEQAGKRKKNCVDSSSQTDETTNDLVSTPLTVIKTSHSGKVDVQHSIFEDSEVIVHLPKTKDVGRKFFDSSVSPEQQQRLLPVQPPVSTPDTVIRVPTKHVRPLLQSPNINGEVDERLLALRSENQHLLARLADMRNCVQRAIKEKQDAELELTRLQTASVSDETNVSRLSQGLQSFLEHESRLQQMETMEQLQRQVYELEEQFAKKHDALTRTEVAYQQMKSEKDELTQRLLSQADELGRLHHEILDAKNSHQDELEAFRERITHELRVHYEELLEEQRTHFNLLQPIPPDQEAGIQTSILGNALDIAVQTISPMRPKLTDASQQVQFSNVSVGLQTEQPASETVDLGSPIPSSDHLSKQPVVFKKPLVNPTHDTVHQITGTVVRSDFTESTSPQSKPQRNLRLRRKANRSKQQGNFKSDLPPRLPSPVPLPQLHSDSESEHEGKENRALSFRVSDSTCDDVEDDDAISFTSEPVKPLQKQPYSTRRTRSAPKSSAETIVTRPRQTRSAAATRRLPPLAESTQLIPDSFFQDELDAATAHVIKHCDLAEERRQLRQPPRPQLRRRR